MVTYIYNVNGQITNIIPGIDNQREIAFDYNIYGDLLSVRQGSKTIVTYEYLHINDNSLELVTEETYGNGDYIRYEYNKKYNISSCYKINT